jgi:hypothetical protein
MTDEDLVDLLLKAESDLDKPLEKARSIHPLLYCHPRVFEWEREFLFRRGWISVARSAELAEPGRWKTVERFGESILLTRDKDGGPEMDALRHAAAIIGEPPSLVGWRGGRNSTSTSSRFKEIPVNTFRRFGGIQ